MENSGCTEMFKNVFWKEEEPSPPKRETVEKVEEEKEVVKPEEEEYNPFEHRHVTHPTTDYGALAHLLKTSLGTGILAMPMAFRHAGLILGTLGTIIVGIVCAHCVQLLVTNSQRLCKAIRVPTLSYSATAEAAFQIGPPHYRKFGNSIGVLITSELLLSFILGNTVYVVFISHSIYQIVEFYLKPDIDIRLYTISLWIPLTLMCMMPNLRSLVPFSILANILVVLSFGITMYYIFIDITPEDTVELVAPFETWSLFLATIVFSVEGIGAVLPIENEMEHPDHFLGPKFGMFYISMTIVIFLYTFVGFFGYLEYGNKTKGSITLNLPIKEPLAQSVKVLIAVAIFFTYALQFYVPIRIIMEILINKVKKKYHRLCSIMVRILLVSVTMTISLIIPHLEPIISLVGAICFSMLGFLFPALIDIIVLYPSFGPGHWRLWKDILIIGGSLTVLVAGAYASLAEIIRTYFNYKVL